MLHLDLGGLHLDSSRLLLFILVLCGYYITKKGLKKGKNKDNLIMNKSDFLSIFLLHNYTDYYWRF